MVILDERPDVMRWPWKHEDRHPTPLEEAVLLTEALLAEHDRLVVKNQANLNALRESVNIATARKETLHDPR